MEDKLFVEKNIKIGVVWPVGVKFGYQSFILRKKFTNFWESQMGSLLKFSMTMVIFTNEVSSVS